MGRRCNYVPEVVGGVVTMPGTLGNPCYAPLAGHSQGVCFENGHILIALAILACCFAGDKFGGLCGAIGGLKGLS
jgi:hypothetical protein